jgi:hypothetical protein
MLLPISRAQLAVLHLILDQLSELYLEPSIITLSEPLTSVPLLAVSSVTLEVL